MAQEGRLGTTSINKTITRLAQILEVAVEYGYAERNVAKGRNRRLKAVKPRRTFLDRAEHFEVLLDAAATLDTGSRRGGRRALLAVYLFSGLRADEALSLRWRDVRLADGTLTVTASKTEAGVRTVDLLPVLRDELLAHRATRSGDGPSAYVFGTSTGGKLGYSNVRSRILAPAIEIANQRLAERGMEPLPEGLSLHSFRRSFASVCVALGEDPSTVMNQMGHTDSAFTLSVYSQAMRRKDGDRERLRRLVNGEAIGHTPGPGDPIERVQTGTDDASTGTGSRKGQTA